jgi:hypothetical protein
MTPGWDSCAWVCLPVYTHSGLNSGHGRREFSRYIWRIEKIQLQRDNYLAWRLGGVFSATRTAEQVGAIKRLQRGGLGGGS